MLLRSSSRLLSRTALRRAGPSARSMSSSDRPEPQQVDSLLQIGSRRIYDETHDMYRETVRNFYNEKLVPFHEEWENKGGKLLPPWMEGSLMMRMAEERAEVRVPWREASRLDGAPCLDECLEE